MGTSPDLYTAVGVAYGREVIDLFARYVYNTNSYQILHDTYTSPMVQIYLEEKLRYFKPGGAMAGILNLWGALDLAHQRNLTLAAMGRTSAGSSLSRSHRMNLIQCPNCKHVECYHCFTERCSGCRAKREAEQVQVGNEEASNE